VARIARDVGSSSTNHSSDSTENTNENSSARMIIKMYVNIVDINHSVNKQSRRLFPVETISK